MIANPTERPSSADSCPFAISVPSKTPTLPTLTLSIKGLQAGYPTLEATLTPTLENLSTNFSVQPLFLQFSRVFVGYSLSNFR